jgi:hypothetical protein
MGLDDPAVTEETQSIDPRLDQAGGSFMDMLMGAAAVNPWDLESTGPRIAAMNQSQQDVMNQTAGAGNAFNMGFTSAAEGLPQATDMNGMQAYDSLGLAKQGISPAMADLYSNIYGDNGLMSQYALENGQPRGSSGGGEGGNIDPNWVFNRIAGINQPVPQSNTPMYKALNRGGS